MLLGFYNEIVGKLERSLLHTYKISMDNAGGVNVFESALIVRG